MIFKYEYSYKVYNERTGSETPFLDNYFFALTDYIAIQKIGKELKQIAKNYKFNNSSNIIIVKLGTIVSPHSGFLEDDSLIKEIKDNDVITKPKICVIYDKKTNKYVKTHELINLEKIIKN